MKVDQVAIIRHFEAVGNKITPDGYKQAGRVAKLLGLDDLPAAKSLIISSLPRRGVDTALELALNRSIPVQVDVRLGNVDGRASLCGVLKLIHEQRILGNVPTLVAHAELAKAIPLYFKKCVFEGLSLESDDEKLLGQCGTVAIIDFTTQTVTIIQ
jgi:hypothetical protein